MGNLAARALARASAFVRRSFGEEQRDQQGRADDCPQTTTTTQLMRAGSTAKSVRWRQLFFGRVVAALSARVGFAYL